MKYGNPRSLASLRIMKKFTFLLLFLLFSCCSLIPVFSDENREQEISLFQTPIQAEFLQKSGLLLESFNGTVQPIDDPRGVRKILWSTCNDAEWIGVEFGKETALGTRYTVASWGESVTVGSLIVVTTSRPKLLKENVVTGENGILTAEQIADDENWISGVRLLKNGDVTEEVTGIARDELTVWMFPPETKSRAIRFEHTPLATDKTYAGWIGAVYVVSERVTNLAPFATVRVSAQEQYAERLNDGTYNDVWQTWDNGPERNPEHRLYAVAGWEMEKESARGECCVTALTDAGDRAVCKYPYETNLIVNGKPNHEQAVAGVAVWNGMVLMVLNRAENQLVCIAR